jgi:hypothetical protein
MSAPLLPRCFVGSDPAAVAASTSSSQGWQAPARPRLSDGDSIFGHGSDKYSTNLERPP